jgi:hypothetical protein
VAQRTSEQCPASTSDCSLAKPRCVGGVAVPADRPYSRAMESAILSRAIAAVLVAVMVLAVLGALWVHFAGPELAFGALLGQ